MKFRITCKDPDGPIDDIAEAASIAARAIPDLSDEEREFVMESRREQLRTFASKWIEFGEYLAVEFDTELGTATVLEVKR